MKDNDKKKIDVKNINEMTSIGTKILKILYFLIIILAIYAVTLINKEWGIFKFILTILSVISPLFIGIIIAYLLNPLINRMTRNKKMNRTVATSIVFIILLIVIYLSCSYLFPVIGKEVRDLIKYIPNVIDSVNDFINGILHRLNISGMSAELTESIKNTITSGLTSFTTDIPNHMFGAISSVIKDVILILFGFVISFYLLIDFDRAQDYIYVFVPKKYRKDVHYLLSTISEQIFSFVKGTGFVALLVFIVSAVCFGCAGLRAAIFFALWNAITNIIPYIGPYIGGIPIVAVAFATDYKLGIIILIIVLAIQLIESYILSPIVMSKTMKLHPVTIIISLLIFDYFFGIIGMLIATPLTAIIKTIILFIDEKLNIRDRLRKRNSFGDDL
ncbi:MAG: AI-2E family transporter [Bacilli bacterium]|nr:AI-2E family transporter [Bacilli bacterium]